MAYFPFFFNNNAFIVTENDILHFNKVTLFNGLNVTFCNGFNVTLCNDFNALKKGVRLFIAEHIL